MADAALSLLELPTLRNLILFCIPLLWCLSAIRSYRRLRDFKGPLSGAFSKLWMIRSTYHGRMHLDVEEVCKKYGHLTRIGPNDLVTDDPEILRKMSGVRSPYSRSDWYNATAFDHKISHVFCERDEERHVEMRNKMIPGYSGKENEHLEQSIDSQLFDLFRLIREKYTSTANDYRPVDMARLCQFLTLDVITNLAFGEPMGFLFQDKDVHGYIANQTAMLPIFEWFSTLPILEKIIRIPLVSKYAMPSPKDQTGAGLLLGVAKRIVAERFGPNKKSTKDMLGSFVSHGLTQAEAEQESVLQIFAGSDTTATAIRTMVLFMATQPDTLSILQGELDRAEQEGHVSSPIITYEEAKTLPFLQACVKEGLRIWPPVMGLMQKSVPPAGDYLDGKFVPGGTQIGYCAWGVHRNREIFGGDADMFRPGRWFEKDEQKLAEMNRTHDLVFGSGRYACLGKPVALIELSKALAEIFRRYDIAVINPSRPWESVNRNGLFVQSKLFVRISERLKTIDFLGSPNKWSSPSPRVISHEGTAAASGPNCEVAEAEDAAADEDEALANAETMVAAVEITYVGRTSTPGTIVNGIFVGRGGSTGDDLSI